MTFADMALARRLESAEAANARGCAGPDVAVMEAGGGCAVFAGADSPLTQVVGIGLAGPVRAAELDVVEKFLRSRGAGVTIDLCPLAEPRLLEDLVRRGYRPAEFNNVLVKRLVGTSIVMTPRVRRAVAGEADVWSHAVGHGFFEQPDLTTAEMEVGRHVFAMPEALCYLAVAGSREPAGGGAMTVRDGLATLFADATIARFRRQGLHSELIAARLNEAIARGGELASATTQPGSASQRNYERLGFEVAYTKVTMAA